MNNMLFESWLAGAQLWQVGLIILIALFVAASVGFWLRMRGESRATDLPEDKEDREKDREKGQEGYLVSSVLGLFAFLLGFTFALAVDRYDARRGFVLAEANAIGTAYLRTQLLESPHRARLSQLLVDYTDNRIALARQREPVPPEMLQVNDRLVTQLWQATVSAFPTMKDYDFSSTYLESMNAVIDLDTSRKTARRAHVPATVFVVLGIYGICTAGVLGYVLVGARGRITAIAVMALFALSFLLIIDIDRPTLGTIRESQIPIEMLRNSLQQSWQPSIFDPTPP